MPRLPPVTMATVTAAPYVSVVATWKTVQKLAAKLPETEEGTSYGTPAMKVKGKLVARLREEGDILAIYTDDKEAQLSAAPDVYFSTPHYDGYPMVLVRLPKISEGRAARALHRRVAHPCAQGGAEGPPRRLTPRPTRRVGGR